MSKRRYLSSSEIDLLIESASKRTTGVRDQCLILMAYIHGYRITELLSLTFSDIDLISGSIFIKRSKRGFSTTQPLLDQESALLLQWFVVRETYKNAHLSQSVFLSRRGTPLSRKQAYNIVKQSGTTAGITVSTHPHMLRHACGYALAERGVNTRLIQDYLGHRNIRHTVHYTASNVQRFTDIWVDEHAVR